MGYGNSIVRSGLYYRYFPENIDYQINMPGLY